MKFENLQFNDVPHLGNNAIQAHIEYPDTEYVMSVVRHAGSYGFELNRYELGIFKGDSMVKFPPITHEDDQVRGFLKEFEIEKYINQMGDILNSKPRNKGANND
tara:strand:- start:221 stop:532 length:312 start_codon:yes stop_codon:yes gene_type:complete